jgi:hypothetical protein
MSGWFVTTYVLLWVVALLALGVNFVTLGYVFDILSKRESVLPTPQLLGRRLPTVSLVTPAGAVTGSDQLLDEHTAILVLSPHCKACKEILAEGREVIAGAAERGWRVVAIVRDKVQSLRASNYEGLPADVPLLVDEAGVTESEWEMSIVPSALIIGKGGRVQGVLRAISVRDLQSLFGRAPDSGEKQHAGGSTGKAALAGAVEP